MSMHDIRSKKIHEQIDEAIRVYGRLLLILSEHSMNSELVKTGCHHLSELLSNQKRLSLAEAAGYAERS